MKPYFLQIQTHSTLPMLKHSIQREVLTKVLWASVVLGWGQCGQLKPSGTRPYYHNYSVFLFIISQHISWKNFSIVMFLCSSLHHVRCYIPASAQVTPLKLPPCLLPFWIQVPCGFLALSSHYLYHKPTLYDAVSCWTTHVCMCPLSLLMVMSVCTRMLEMNTKEELKKTFLVGGVHTKIHS